MGSANWRWNTTKPQTTVEEGARGRTCTMYDDDNRVPSLLWLQNSRTFKDLPPTIMPIPKDTPRPVHR